MAVTASSEPTHFYLLSSTGDLRLVSRAVLSGAPEWWRVRFGVDKDSRFREKPLYQHTTAALNVYAVTVSTKMLDAMLEMIQVPECVNEYWRHLPLALQSETTLLAWRGFMRGYGYTRTDYAC